MPKGPNGEKRPADAIGLAVMVGRIATGEAEDAPDHLASQKRQAAGKKGGVAKMANLTAEQRSEAAKLASSARWRKEDS